MDKAIITACKLLGIDPEPEAIEGYGEAEVMKYAAILRESFPAPSEPAKNAMELAQTLALATRQGEDIHDLAALIQSSFEAWRGSPHGYTMVKTELWDQLRALLASRPTPTAEKAAGCTCGYSATESDRCKAHDKPTDEKALRERVEHIINEFESVDPMPDAPAASIHGVGRSLRKIMSKRLREVLLSHESPKEQE